MSKPFTVHAVGVRPLSEGLEVVGATVGDRLAGTFVVDAGHGEPLARLLLSGPIVEAARKVAELYRSRGGLGEDDQLQALCALGRAIATVDAVDPKRTADVPTPDIPRPPPRALKHHAQPAQEIVEACNTLFYGNPEGAPGDSIFRAVAVAGVVLVATPDGGRPRPFGSFNGARDALECWRPLAAQLREIAEGIDGQCFAAEVATGVCRVCGCTDDDCSQCVVKTGEPCHWVEPDLCSACEVRT